MKTITLYETIEELKNHLMEIEFKGVKEEKHSSGKTWIIDIEMFVFRADRFRNGKPFQCESIHKNDLIFQGERIIEYLLWDYFERDFYSIKDKKIIDRIEKYLS